MHAYKPYSEPRELPLWYENMNQEDYMNKLVYKIEKTIPAVVQQVLEQMGFIEWDPDVHQEDQWNILWKN